MEVSLSQRLHQVPDRLFLKILIMQLLFGTIVVNNNQQASETP